MRIKKKRVPGGKKAQAARTQAEQLLARDRDKKLEGMFGTYNSLNHAEQRLRADENTKENE